MGKLCKPGVDIVMGKLSKPGVPIPATDPAVTQATVLAAGGAVTQDIRAGSQGVGGNQGLAGIWPGKEWPADYRPGAGQALQVLN